MTTLVPSFPSDTPWPHVDHTPLHVIQTHRTATPVLSLVPDQRPLSYLAELSEDEEIWRDRYSFLLSRGLQLRVRYRPEWTPSWLGANLDPMTCEDSIEKRVSSFSIFDEFLTS